MKPALRPAAPPAASPQPPSAFAALLAPFAALPEEKQDVLREVLQIYVSKDSGKHTEQEKRKRLTSLINDHVKGATDEEDDA
jgi:hypothetical protein